MKHLGEQIIGLAFAVQEQEHAGEQSRMRALTTEALLQQLPMLQRLMARLVDCKPTGAACQDHVVQVNFSTSLARSSLLRLLCQRVQRLPMHQRPVSIGHLLQRTCPSLVCRTVIDVIAPCRLLCSMCSRRASRFTRPSVKDSSIWQTSSLTWTTSTLRGLWRSTRSLSSQQSACRCSSSSK